MREKKRGSTVSGGRERGEIIEKERKSKSALRGGIVTECNLRPSCHVLVAVDSTVSSLEQSRIHL